jgi:hypothetical protein
VSGWDGVGEWMGEGGMEWVSGKDRMGWRGWIRMAAAV